MTKSIKSKKFASLILAVVLVFALAAPAMAADTVGNPTLSAGSYRIYPNGVTSHLLNVYGNGNANDNVTLYTPTNGNDQIWRLVSAGSSYYYVVSALSSTQALNVYHATNNCQLYSYVGNTTDDRSDSAVYFSTSSRYIRLRDWASLRLSFGSVSTNANVYWSSTFYAWGWERV